MRRRNVVESFLQFRAGSRARGYGQWRNERKKSDRTRHTYPRQEGEPSLQRYPIFRESKIRRLFSFYVREHSEQLKIGFLPRTSRRNCETHDGSSRRDGVRCRGLIEAVGTRRLPPRPRIESRASSKRPCVIFPRVSLRRSHKVIRKTALARTDFICRRISASFKTVVKQRRTVAPAAPRHAAPRIACAREMRALSQLTYPFVIFRPSRPRRMPVISLLDYINLSCVGKNN